MAVKDKMWGEGERERWPISDEVGQCEKSSSTRTWKLIKKLEQDPSECSTRNILGK